jgi:serpin B
MKSLRSFAVLSAILLLMAVNSSAEPVGTPTSGGSAAATLVQGNTEFGLRFYQLVSREGGNVVVSPLSVSVAAAMLHAGAAGETRAEIASALRFGLPGETLHSEFGKILRELNSRVSRWAKLSFANGLWVDDDCSLVSEYEELLSNYYGAGAQTVDFGGSPTDACGIVNDWVSNETNGKIDAVIVPEMLTDRTRAILVNTIYFLGAWKNRFHANSTREEPFHLLDGSSTRVPMMHRRGQHRYFDGESVQVLELKYQGSGLSMLVVLPAPDVPLAEVESGLTPAVLSGWVENLQTRGVDMAIPRFEVKQRVDLIPVLSELGMQRAFKWGAADLTGVCADPDLFVEYAHHHVTLGITEQGTEGAAATVELPRFHGQFTFCGDAASAHRFLS